MAFWNGEPVAFTSYIHQPHAKTKNLRRAHRTVVLPDYQGVGIGNRLVECIGDHCLESGYRFTSVTSHPSMIHYRNRNPKWRMVRKPSHVAKVGKSGMKSIYASASVKRMTASFEYLGKYGKAKGSRKR